MIELAGRQTLDLERSDGQDVLRVAYPDGRVSVRIVVTPAGPVVHLSGAGLVLHADGPVAIEGERVAIHARDGLVLSSGGDAAIRADGALRTEAFEQHHRAHTGDMGLYANDDVRIDGERIRMNA